MVYLISTLVVAAFLIAVGRVAYLRQKPKQPKSPDIPPGGQGQTTATATVKKEEPKKWLEWKKYEWLIPIVAWVLILITLALTFPDLFWAWAWDKHWQVFLATNVVILGIILLWYKQAGSTGRQLATATLLVILALGYAVDYKFIPKDWQKWSLKDIERALIVPDSVKQVLRPPVDTGVPWTRATKDGDVAFLCILKPGETSKLMPMLDFPFKIDRDYDIDYIVGESHHLIPASKVLTPHDFSQMGINGYGGIPRVRLKLPEYWPQEEQIKLVFKTT